MGPHTKLYSLSHSMSGSGFAATSSSPLNRVKGGAIKNEVHLSDKELILGIY